MYYLSTAIHGYAHSYIVSQSASPTVGLLIGKKAHKGAIDIFNIVFISDLIDADHLAERAISLQQVLPGNIDVIGLAYFHGGDQEKTEAGLLGRVESVLCQKLDLNGIPILSMPFNELIADRLDFGRQLGTARWYDADSQSIQDVTDQAIVWRKYSDMLSKRVTIRLRLSIPWAFNCQTTADAGEIEQEIRRYFEHRLANIIVDKSYFVAFRNGENVLLLLKLSQDRQVIGSVPEKASLLDLFNHISDSKRKELVMHQDVIDCNVVEKVTHSYGRNGNGEGDNELTIVPVVQYEASDFLHFNIPHNLEIVLVCNQDDQISDLPSMILDSFRRSIAVRLKQLLKYSDLKKKKFCILESFVFFPRQCGHYVLDYYPVGYSDDQLESSRRELHKLFGLRLVMPLFRRSNKFAFPHERGPYLTDVHEAVGDPGIAATMIGLVSGHYQYRHYMQDNIDDKNWGCAYRSFQTIWSWFLLNGYTEKPVPSHREVQQALVDIGDKEPKFVGSRQWVGSLELSYCLDHMANITSKILSVTTGDEMGQKARELIHHFRIQGTPVMIGGGVLAHTILGVAYDEDSGEAKFLVLDPHYTGEENIKTIVDKGWCDWKPLSFWDKTAFYNMMLPLRPEIY